LGGIIGGIAGAFFIFGAALLIIFLCRRKLGEAKSATLSQYRREKGESVELDAAEWPTPDTRLRYPEEQNQVGGRVESFPE
jgi:hypothetical protein